MAPKTWPFWTDATGTGHVRIEVGNPALMDKKDVSGKVKTDQTSVTDGDWYYRTKKLKDGAAGFWTDVSDRSVMPGQTGHDQDLRAERPMATRSPACSSTGPGSSAGRR